MQADSWWSAWEGFHAGSHGGNKVAVVPGDRDPVGQAFRPLRLATSILPFCIPVHAGMQADFWMNVWAGIHSGKRLSNKKPDAALGHSGPCGERASGLQPLTEVVERVLTRRAGFRPFHVDPKGGQRPFREAESSMKSIPFP
jgi:hypothetical protein